MDAYEQFTRFSARLKQWARSTFQVHPLTGGGWATLLPYEFTFPVARDLLVPGIDPTLPLPVILVQGSDGVPRAEIPPIFDLERFRRLGELIRGAQLDGAREASRILREEGSEPLGASPAAETKRQWTART